MPSNLSRTATQRIVARITSALTVRRRGRARCGPSARPLTCVRPERFARASRTSRSWRLCPMLPSINRRRMKAKLSGRTSRLRPRTLIPLARWPDASVKWLKARKHIPVRELDRNDVARSTTVPMTQPRVRAERRLIPVVSWNRVTNGVSVGIRKWKFPVKKTTKRVVVAVRFAHIGRRCRGSPN